MALAAGALLPVVIFPAIMMPCAESLHVDRLKIR
jgi:hypothetical protein